ncbi:MAG: hypothetical protein M3019_01965 [Candidatus Dormibacteraeota bacterium]|nr:hypothetical protein [Candidatus Dormibacteraeota bacterium]
MNDLLRARPQVLIARSLLVIGALLVVAACGSATGASTSTTEPSTAQPTAAAATPTPPPPPPLAVLQASVPSDIHVVDSTGHTQWSLTDTAARTLLSLGPNDGVEVRPAGVNLFVFGCHDSATTALPGGVAVLDSTGKVIGKGAFDKATTCGDVAADPSGPRWAWSVDDSLPATPGVQHHGRIMVAGLGTAARSVYSWLAPVDASERVGAWTDMGIVMQRLTFGGCGPGFHPDTASFLINPSKETLSDLFDGASYLDARHGVRVSLAAGSHSAILVDGARFDYPATIIDGAYVSPDGALVGVGRLTPLPCAGGDQSARVHTQLITVATGAQVELPGCEIRGWFDAGHFVCQQFTDPTSFVEDLSGHMSATLGKGNFLGVLQQ